MTNNEANFLSSYSQFLDASGEHLSYSALSIYRNFSWELSDKEKIFFRKHLDSCTACSARLIEIANVEGEEAERKPKNILNFSSNTFRYAIAATLIIAIGVSILFISRNNQEEKFTSQETAPEQSFAVAAINPEKFTPNQILENGIERTVRSASGVSLLAPLRGDTLSAPITIRWKGEQRGRSFTVTVVDNKNSEMWIKETSSTELTVEKKLEPGLYYIKLEVNGKLVQVGKFVVAR